jgi:fatty-acid peroxygenase
VLAERPSAYRSGMPNAALPHLRGDRSLQLLADPYRFIGRHADRLGTDGFRTRVMGRRITCLRGADAARFFGEGGRFDRVGAIPATARRLLQDDGSVQTVRGREHLVRKAAFLEVLGSQGGRSMTEALDTAWRRRATVRASGPVDVHAEAVQLLGEAVLAWAGVPLDQDDPDAVTAELQAMFENAGRFGPRNALARARRTRTEARARRWIDRARSGDVPADTVVSAVAGWTDADGAPLPSAVAAIELLNLLRPTVAVAEFLVWAALALAVRPGEQERVRTLSGYSVAFAHEVRRHAPFFPVIAGRATGPLRWHEARFADRDWVMLDLYGTNHDARIWNDPERFRPMRFLEGIDPRMVIAQGAGDFTPDHRCPGEDLTNALVARFAELLAGERWATEGAPDPRMRFSRIPAHPRTPLVLRFAG